MSREPSDTPPMAEKRKVLTPRRLPNWKYRSREHLTPDEVARWLPRA